MPALLHHGPTPYSATGRGDELAEAWAPGTVRVVTEEQAEYLLHDFPGRFSLAPVAVVVDAPPADRAMHSPRTRARR